MHRCMFAQNLSTYAQMHVCPPFILAHIPLQEDPKTGCFLVGRVRPDSPAQEAGVEVGDVLVEIDGRQVFFLVFFFKVSWGCVSRDR
jgi:predicted metalloprotease with PDZ domain